METQCLALFCCYFLLHFVHAVLGFFVGWLFWGFWFFFFSSLFSHDLIVDVKSLNALHLLQVLISVLYDRDVFFHLYYWNCFHTFLNISSYFLGKCWEKKFNKSIDQVLALWSVLKRVFRICSLSKNINPISYLLLKKLKFCIAWALFFIYPKLSVYRGELTSQELEKNENYSFSKVLCELLTFPKQTSLVICEVGNVSL